VGVGWGGGGGIVANASQGVHFALCTSPPPRHAASAQGLISGTVRLQLLEPQSQAYRWPNQQAPYCLGVNSSTDPDYSFPAAFPGAPPVGPFYVFSGSGVGPAGNCTYLDARMAVPDALESGGIFLPTRVSITQQVAQPAADCTELQSSTCVWNTTATTLTYIPGERRWGWGGRGDGASHRCNARARRMSVACRMVAQTWSFSRC
jgi:hypothetical protein